METEDPKQDQP